MPEIPFFGDFYVQKEIVNFAVLQIKSYRTYLANIWRQPKTY